MLTIAFLCATALSYTPPSSEHAIYSTDEAVLRQAWEYSYKVGKGKNGTLDPILSPWMKDMGKVRSPNWQKWQASFCIHLPPAVRVMVAGFNDGRSFLSYEESQGKKAIDDIVAGKSATDRTIQFFVSLIAWPGISDFNRATINRKANQDDVKATDFILLVDGKPVRLLRRTDGAQQTEDGEVIAPVTDQTEVSSRIGGRVYRSTVTYTTSETRGFAWYKGDFRLVFPYFDKEGNPNITAETKKLELRAVKVSGKAQDAVFEIGGKSLVIPK